MSTTKTITTTTPVNASKEDVFSAVTDWESQHKWIFATKVRGVGDNSHKLGGKLEAFTGFGKLGFLDTMTITRWDPPNACEVTHTGKLVKGSGLFQVSSKDDTTFFTWTENIELPFGIIGRAGWPLVKPIAHLGLKLSLKRFSKLF